MARPEIAAGVQPAPLARHEFEVAPDLIYLNHAAVGVLPRRTRLAVDEFVRAQARRGGLGVAPFEAQIDAARERVARLVGGRADRIAFLRNTSDGANVIARGLDWQPGDEIVVSDNEFGANVRPWLALREHGVVIRFVPTAHERLTPTVLARMLSARTRVIAVSWVGFLDGYRHDLAGLAAVAHDGGAWLCVDAIQGLGVLPCDVEALGVDALYAGTGKWLLGLAGLGLLYLRDDLQAVVQPRWRGWRDVADIWDDFNYDQPLAQGAQRYEGGTLNFLGVHALLASLDVLEAAQIGRIGAHVLALTDALVDGLLSIGVEIVSERGAAASGIVTFRLAGRDCVATGARLAAAGIVVTARPSGIRVSPHGYNTLAEIAALIDALGALC